MKEILVIVLSDDDSDVPLSIKRPRLLQTATTLKNNYAKGGKKQTPPTERTNQRVIVLSDDDSDAPVTIKRRRVENNANTLKKTYVQGVKKQIQPTKTTKQRMIVLSDDDSDTKDGNTIWFNKNEKKQQCSVSKTTTMNLIDEPTNEEFNEFENFNDDFASFFDDEANDVADSKAETVTNATTEFATWEELADQSGIDLNESDMYSVRSVSDGDEADSFINDDSTDSYDSDDNDY